MLELIYSLPLWIGIVGIVLLATLPVSIAGCIAFYFIDRKRNYTLTVEPLPNYSSSSITLTNLTLEDIKSIEFNTNKIIHVFKDIVPPDVLYPFCKYSIVSQNFEKMVVKYEVFDDSKSEDFLIKSVIKNIEYTRFLVDFQKECKKNISVEQKKRNILNSISELDLNE